jgi:protein-tyrosine phosphatase
LQLGFDADIDLEELRAEEPPHTKIYLWLPTKDHTPPIIQQLKIGVSALTSLVEQHMKVYVHCKNGHGRAPTLVAAYLISQGMGVDEAFAFIKKRRPVIHPEPGQVEALNEFAAQVIAKQQRSKVIIK